MRSRFGTACLMLAFVLMPISASLALTVRSGDVCAMSCCVAAGSCCCTPRHTTVQGQLPDGQAHFNESQLMFQCPKDCALLANSAPVFIGNANSKWVVVLKRDGLRFAPRSVSGYEFTKGDAVSPRGPPLFWRSKTSLSLQAASVLVSAEQAFMYGNKAGTARKVLFFVEEQISPRCSGFSFC